MCCGGSAACARSLSAHGREFVSDDCGRKGEGLFMDEELIVLYDEEGNEQSFAYLDTIEMNGESYLALTPVYEDEEEEDSEDTEVVFMKLTRDEENPNEDLLLIVDDDDELDEVFAEFTRRIEEEE